MSNSAKCIETNANLDSIIKIQSIVRKYLASKKILIPSSEYQSKVWRKSQRWYRTGKHNECEIYQINLIKSITKLKLFKSSKRIHIESNDIVDKIHPLKYQDGYEYTETFDGYQSMNNSSIYYNLKFVCDSGGAQTRSLREVYHFIRYQLEYLMVHDVSTYFMNILDGDTAFNAQSKFEYLLNKSKYAKVKKYVFIGDLAKFQSYWLSLSI